MLITRQSALAQDQFAPQLWTSIDIGVDISEKWGSINEVAYNVLLSEDLEWNETSLFVSFFYKHKAFIDYSIRVDYSRTQQSKELSSQEVRPSVGIRLRSSNKKRFVVLNLLKFEYRQFFYNNGVKDNSGRLRNNTVIFAALNKPQMAETNNLYFMAGFEVFYNTNNQLEERFFNLYRLKASLGYKFLERYNAYLLYMFQQSNNNLDEPVNLPVNVETRYIFSINFSILIQRNQ